MALSPPSKEHTAQRHSLLTSKTEPFITSPTILNARMLLKSADPSPFKICPVQSHQDRDEPRMLSGTTTTTNK